MERVVAPPSPEAETRRTRAVRNKEIQDLRAKGTRRTPAERDRLLDLLSEQVLNQ